MKGPEGRYASIRISQESLDLALLVARLKTLEKDRSYGDILARIKNLEDRPPIEKHFTEALDTTKSFSDKFGIQVSAGVSTSPFGGMPILAGGVTWERNLFLEGIFGHTLWKDDFAFGDLTLETKTRMIGGQLTYFPFENHRLGFLGGWVRIEEISDQYYEYVKLSEGPMFGLRFTPLNNISIIAAYNPAKQRLITEEFSISKNGQFIFSITFAEIFGGGQ